MRCGRAVDGVQLTPGLLDNRSMMPAWMLEAVQRKAHAVGGLQIGEDGRLRLWTRRGVEKPEVGDWLIREPDGSLWSVSAEAFDRDWIVDLLVDEEMDPVMVAAVGCPPVEVEAEGPVTMGLADDEPEGNPS